MDDEFSKRLEALHERAERLAPRPEAASPPSPPSFVEFAGSPKSGKSTCIDIVGHFFRRKGFRVLAPTEGASKRTPFFLKRDLFAFNTWSACYALTHVLEGLHQAERYDIAILDRGMFDALAWFDLLSQPDLPDLVPGAVPIARADRDRIHQFLLIDKWIDPITAVFLFRADPETSMKRELGHKLTSEPGTAMRPDFLAALNSAYDRVTSSHKSRFSEVRMIDTSSDANTSPRSTALDVAEHILDLLDRGRL